MEIAIAAIGTICAALITAIVGPLIVFYFTNQRYERLKETQELLQLQKSGAEESTKIDNASSEDSPLMNRARSLYLRHTIGPWEKQYDGVERRPIEIWLSTRDRSNWDKIERVVYYLPSSFPNRVRDKTNISEWFSTQTAAYGEFTVGAEVFFKGEKEPLRINRYIDFYDAEDETKSVEGYRTKEIYFDATNRNFINDCSFGPGDDAKALSRNNLCILL